VLNRKYGLANIVEPQSAADIAATMKRKEIAHPTGRNWSHEAIKPVHDAAIKRLKGRSNIDEFREFLRALTDHLDMIKSQGAVKIVGPGLLLRRIAGRQVLTACGDLAKSLALDNGKGQWVHTSRGKNFVIAKGNEMKEIDDLLKSTGIAESFLKSHVKEYTRTTASGATVTVKEHDDKRIPTAQEHKKYGLSSDHRDAADDAFGASDAAEEHKTSKEHERAAVMHHHAANRNEEVAAAAPKNSFSQKNWLEQAARHRAQAKVHEERGKKLVEQEERAKNPGSKENHVAIGKEIDKKVTGDYTRKPRSWDESHGGEKAKESDLKGTEARHFSQNEVYGEGNGNHPDDDFSDEFKKKLQGHGHAPFVLKKDDGHKYVVDSQGYDYARYIAHVKKWKK
jgi:hypothetical protein